MGLKIFGAFAALLLVAACETAPEAMMDADGGGAAMAAMTPSPITAQPTRPLAWPEPPIVPGSSNEFVKVVGDRVFFGFDQFSLTERAQESLKRQAEWLNLYPLVKIVVQGHADERGTREYNLALGERRANAVRNYLTALNVDADRISTISYGKERPVALGSNATAWTLNRRAVTAMVGALQVN